MTCGLERGVELFLIFLSAAQLALILQNTFVVICAAGVYAFLWFQHDIIVSEKREWLVPLCQAGIIVFAIFADLASLARMIAVERDWIVEICGKDKDLLASKWVIGIKIVWVVV